MYPSIIYRDPYFVAINKPSGLLVHRSSIDKTETQFAVQMLRDQIGQRVYPIHRLDKPTSGVLLFAFTPEAVRALAMKWESVDKRYVAIARGCVQTQTIDHPLTSISPSGNERVQDAQTEVEVLACAREPVVFGKRSEAFTHTTFSLIQARLHTGRYHQIRKHLKHIHHPIVGDTRYGRGEINRYFRGCYGSHRLLLHCQSLCFIHPFTQSPVGIYASFDAQWSRLLVQMPWVW